MMACNAVHVFVLISVVLLGVRCHSPETDERKRSDDSVISLESLVSAQDQKLSALEAKVQAVRNWVTTLSSSQGSSFVRWGRSTCPRGTTLLYSGYGAGASNRHSGGGANRLCVTKVPLYDDTPLNQHYGELNGAQYNLPGHYFTDVLCAVCLSAHAVTYMVPGTYRCPEGSVEQYSGYLIAGDPKNDSPSEFLCLDAHPEDRAGSQQNLDSAYFEHVRSHCGSLPCPPYQQAKVVTCVVCSV